MFVRWEKTQKLQMLYGGSLNVSFFKVYRLPATFLTERLVISSCSQGDGEPQIGPIVDMPDNSSSGEVSI